MTSYAKGRPWAVRLLALVAISATIQTAALADGEHLTAYGADPELDRALQAALAPVGMNVVPAKGAPPTDRAAATPPATAAVWVSPVPGGSSNLWVYDQPSDQMMARVLAFTPPLDAVRATAVALMVRTMLGTLRGWPAPEPPPPPRPEPPPPVAAVAPMSEISAAPTAPAPLAMWALETSGAARTRADVADIGWRANAGLIRQGPGLGWTLHLGGGGATSFRSAAFVGDLAIYQGTLSARAQFRNGRLFLEPAAGVGVQLTRLQGTLTDRLAESVTVWRFDPALRATTTGGAHLSRRLAVALTLGLDWALRRQRYLVETTRVAELPAVSAEVGLGLRVTF